jgi:hypothetical protein
MARSRLVVVLLVVAVAQGVVGQAFHQGCFVSGSGAVAALPFVAAESDSMTIEACRCVCAPLCCCVHDTRLEQAMGSGHMECMHAMR